MAVNLSGFILLGLKLYLLITHCIIWGFTLPPEAQTTVWFILQPISSRPTFLHYLRSPGAYPQGLVSPLNSGEHKARSHVPQVCLRASSGERPHMCIGGSAQRGPWPADLCPPDEAVSPGRWECACQRSQPCLPVPAESVTHTWLGQTCAWAHRQVSF